MRSNAAHHSRATDAVPVWAATRAPAVTWAGVLLLALLAACGSEKVGRPADDVTSLEDGAGEGVVGTLEGVVGGGDSEGDVEDADAAGDGDAITDGDDSAEGPDGGPDGAETAPDPGTFGTPCQENRDCLSGWCVSSNVGPVCTRACDDACPEGWECRGVAGQTDVAFLCLPKEDHLCQPCSVDTQCGSGLCLTFDEGRRCTAGCGPDGECPPGFACEERQSEAVGDHHGMECVPVHGTCDCLPETAGLERPCSNAGAAGTCWGLQVCQGEGGWSACDAPIPEDELCDGRDNDCDRLSDEGLPGDTPCTITNDFGTCSGRRRCDGASGWTCAAEIPIAEACNYRDDDCDGATDDGFTDGATSLYLDDQHCGVCGNDCADAFPNATAACIEDHGAARCAVTACAPGYYQAGPTSCLPVLAASCLPCTDDRNCVVPGNACVPLDGGTYCAEDCGEGNLNGLAAGTCADGYVCTTVGAGGKRLCMPETGSCGCLSSNDAGRQRSCVVANAFGTCGGTETCRVEDGGFSACSAKAPEAESCNGLDDDCDGQSDEDVVMPLEPCEHATEAGICSGQWRCAGAEGWSCGALEPTPEACNYRDDDCDGAADEDFVDAGSGQYVDLANCGVCGRACSETILYASETECRLEGGKAVCVALACADGYYIPAGTNRVCIPRSGATDCSPCLDDVQCEELAGGRCEVLDGARVCTRSCGDGAGDGGEDGATCEGGFACVDGRCRPPSGSCTCLEAHAGTERPCANQAPEGICGGVEICDPTSGWSACSAVQPSAETCNGLDENCDGRTDENVVHNPSGCQDTNAFGTCVARYRCDGAGGWVCPVETPRAEGCNYQDDDCDGAVDEDFKDAGGRYITDGDCGACGNRCEGVIPNATARCGTTSGAPRCEVATCNDGFFRAGALTCLPAVDTTCTPCATDANCPTPGDHCLPMDGAKFCGRDCSAGNFHGTPAGQCEDGFECTPFTLSGGVEVAQCVPASRACSCLPDDRDEIRPCSLAAADGTCFGTEVCVPEIGWAGCTAAAPSGEVCNGADDDCNGRIDDGVTHAPTICEVTNGFGTCSAGYRCLGATGWICPAAIPAADVCNGLDDDCDAATDEDFRDAAGVYDDVLHCGACGFACDIPNATPTCVVSGTAAHCEVATCDAGFYKASARACLPASDSACLACSSDASCPTPGDKCLALDGGSFCGRDCSGTNRHGLPAGACDAGYTCHDYGGGVAQCIPTTGSCGCLPGDAGETRTCRRQNADGVCFGSETCDVASGWIGCSARVPAAESCNGLDDDCDGSADEGVTHVPALCERTQEGVGTCSAPYHCSGVQGWECPAATPTSETCDFIDNDCDQAVDEPFKNASGQYVADAHCGACGVSCAGAIPHATAACAASGAQPRCEVAACDAGYYQTGPLSCAAVTDNTCAACAVDSDCRVPGDRCVQLAGGKFCGVDCSDGNLHGTVAGACAGEGFVCEAFAGGPNQCVPEGGTCDCLVANEGAMRTCRNDGVTGSCFGTEVCVPAIGWAGCTAAVPTDEVCNGADDDCNGRIDDGVTHAPTVCEVTNDFGTCSAGYRCLGATGWACPATAPAADLCNGADDDCDGAVDEDFRDAQGVYDQVEHCGACGFACDIPNATPTCVVSGTSAHCEVAACDPGFYQANARACLPASDSACLACSSDASCQTPGDKCLALDGGKFCGRDCSSTNRHGLPAGVCDAGFTCHDYGGGVAQCVPISGSCGCLPGDAGETRTCTRQNADGVCFGSEACDPASGWLGCSARVPAAETCNGADDNCNGAIDEGVTHAPATCDRTVAGVGTCTASYHCSGVQGWTCPVATPSAETCDFADNDCDQAIDETFRNATGQYTDVANCGACGVSCVGAIPHATATCSADSGQPRCEVASCDAGYYQTGVLACTAVTNNACVACVADSDCRVPGDRCVQLAGGRFCGVDCSSGNLHGTAAGACENAGFVCQAVAGGRDQCVPQSGACDCLVANEGATRTCRNQSALGICYGVETCDAASGWGGCTARVPAAEACNGGDDDCDGQIDEQLVHDPSVCTREAPGIGTCSASYSCGGTAGWQCPVATPVAEACNFLDDDCDGATDEAFRNAAGAYVALEHCGSCGVSCVGAIPNATAACAIGSNGQPRCEVAACDPGFYASGPQTCLEATDNSCAPCATDANCRTDGDRCVPLDGGHFCGRDCSAGNAHGTPAGACPAGFTCADIAGGRQCIPLSQSCSCLSGDTGEQRTCFATNAIGTCFGVQTCDAVAGWSACTARVPASESCNASDDDCNASIDDVAGRGAACATTNTYGSCPGVRDCVAGQSALVCAGRTPGPERCNYVDDNCSGATDEGFADLNDSCSNGVGACRRFGIRVCTTDGTATTCNAVAAAPTVERCNNVDDDCDGATDEDPAWANKGLGCSDGLGVCQVSGIYVCAPDGGSTICNQTPHMVESTTEVGHCNGLDDDCDGPTDEDFPDKGQVCSVGLGVCQAFGTRVCAADGSATTCTGVAGPAHPESCDLLDNDCDGATDETYKNASNQYALDATCGNCFTDCTQIYAKPHAYGVCDASGASPGCRLTCCRAGATNAACGGQAVDYYNLNGVPDDGCEFMHDSGAIYVSASDGTALDDGECGLGPAATGGGRHPCKSIGAGLLRAVATGRGAVLVADGLYTETVTLVAGKRVMGGYRADTWERHLASTNTTLQGPTVVSGHTKAVIADGITTATLFEGFVVQGGITFGVGGNSYVFWIRDSGSALEIRNNLVFGGTAGPGSDGASGGNGGDGLPGQTGERSVITGEWLLASCQALGTVPGNVPQCLDAAGNAGTSTCGAGGTNTCDGAATAGGAGAGAVCPNGTSQEPSGAVGASVAGGGAGGTGGLGGHDRAATSGCSTFGTGGFSAEGGAAGDGVDGAAEPGGAGGPGTNSVVSGEWRGAAGSGGGAGRPGGGGGGGGAGGGGDVSQNCNATNNDTLGGSGGGGGAGGCGGGAGAGGTAGGASILVFITNTAAVPPAAESLAAVSGNALIRGNGGAGGRGGAGGKGGLGGDGGLGGQVAGSWAFAMGSGGRGGQGGDGGHGGGGGGGAGGPSYSVYVDRVTGLPTFASTNTLISSGAGGDGGVGGLSSGSSGGDGLDGAAVDTNY